MNPIGAYLARLGYLNQRQIQLLQRVGHAWPEAVRFRPLGGQLVSGQLASSGR